MLLFTLRRLLLAIPTLIGVSLVVFGLVHLAPGDPIDMLMPPEASPDVTAQMKAAYGFDKPLHMQYLLWLGNAASGHFGLSVFNADTPGTPAMAVSDLTVSFPSHAGRVRAVGGISYELRAGETLTILGESGSGKSVGLKAVMGLLPGYAAVGGSVRLNGTDILTLPPKQLAKLRGGAVSMIFQEPMAALDVTVQIQILLLLRQLQQEMSMAVVFVTHDVGMAAEISDRVAVMYAGRFVETGTVRDVLRHPRHPYTAGLLDSTVHGAMRGTPLSTIAGSPPSLAHLPPGCAFAPRCRFAASQCRTDPPVLRPKPGAAVRCIHDAPVRQLAEPSAA